MGIHIYGKIDYIDGLVQGYSISIANALEILQPCTKPSIYIDREPWLLRLWPEESVHVSVLCMVS